MVILITYGWKQVYKGGLRGNGRYMMRLIGNSRMWLLVSNGRYMMRLIGLLLCVTSGWAQLPMFTQLLPFKIQDNAGSMYCSAPTNAMRATCTSKVCSPASSCFDITKVYDNNPSTAYNPPTITTYQFDFYFPQPVQANSFYVTTSGATTQDRPSWTFTASNSTTATYQSVGAFTLTVGTTPKIVNFSTTITASLWRVVATGAGSLQLYIPEMWFYTATCPAGYNAGNGSACTPCNTGTYNPGYTKCVACGSGTYSTGVGGSACTSCPSGTWATAWGLTSSQGCGLCGSGAYMLDAMNCTYCPGGTYSSTAGERLQSMWGWALFGYRGVCLFAVCCWLLQQPGRGYSVHPVPGKLQLQPWSKRLLAQPGLLRPRAVRAAQEVHVQLVQPGHQGLGGSIAVWRERLHQSLGGQQLQRDHPVRAGGWRGSPGVLSQREHGFNKPS